MKYPTQDEAEALLEWTKFANQVFIPSSELREAFKKADELRQSQWDRVFGNNSPWGIGLTKKGKREVVWDNYKAKNLGL